MIVLVYDSATRRIERYCLEPFDPMPYTYHNALSVYTFAIHSESKLLWTTKRALLSWMDLSKRYAQPLRVANAFRRICEGGHPCLSHHYTGVAFDLSPSPEILNADMISYFESSRSHCHIDFRDYPTYPPLSQDDIGVYVLVLQDALYTIGIVESALDGFYGPLTKKAVMHFQRLIGLPDTGSVDRSTWLQLTFLAAGIGKTPSVLHI